MGWSSGSEIFIVIIEAAKRYIPETKQRKAFYKEVYAVFKDHDWDCEEECFEYDPLFEEMYCEEWNRLRKAEIIWTATAAVVKIMTKDELKDSDYMYGHEDQIEDVWGYVEEIHELGRKTFREEYSIYKIHPEL